MSYYNISKSNILYTFLYSKFIVVINLMFLHVLYHSNHPVGLKIIRFKIRYLSSCSLGLSSDLVYLGWNSWLRVAFAYVAQTVLYVFLFWPHELNFHDLDRKIIHIMLYMVPRVTGNGNVFLEICHRYLPQRWQGGKPRLLSYHQDNEKPTGSSTS